MDQFRGYTVAGMFVVNFVGGLSAFPEVMKHHNGLPYFSYADTIMPSFMFAAGFSYRLSAFERFAKLGAARAYGHFVVRSLALVLVSLVMYAGEDLDVKNWAQLTSRRGSLEAHRRALEGKSVGSPGHHRGRPDRDLARDRREHARPDHRLDRAGGRSIS